MAESTIANKANATRHELALKLQRVEDQPTTHRLILVSGQLVSIDIADYKLVSERAWYIGANGYPSARVDGKIVTLHRFLMGPSMLMVDHKDGDRLNNRRLNLRSVTNRQNALNSRPRRGKSSRYKGVSWHAGREKWVAAIAPEGVRVHLGLFEDEEEAAYVYDQFALPLYGEYAYLNLLSC